MSKYLTAPVASDKIPKGIPYIIGNEAAERFSYYGMRTILVVFMTQYLMNPSGELDVMTEEKAKEWYHNFGTAVYAAPLLGAILSDWLLGKYRTILWLSIVYCLGHAALAVDHTRTWLLIGLALIALGSGGIKPCVSAHVGDQFGRTNQHMLTGVFGWFYFSINAGALFSIALTPFLLEEVGPGWAFGVPGILMAIATLLFWMGRKVFVHIPPAGPTFFKQILSDGSLSGVAKLVPIYLFVSMFWALFDQTGAAWVLQAEKMNRNWLGLGPDTITWIEGLHPVLRFFVQPILHPLAAQVQLINPLLILLLVPVFNYGVWPLLGKVMDLRPERKMTIGMFVAAVSFIPVAVAQGVIDAGGSPSILWQYLGFFVITSAEIMVSVVGLELSYTAAPPKVKSLVMSIWLLTVSLGNFITARVNGFIEKEDGTLLLTGAQYYWFFVGLAMVSAVGFAIAAYFYKGKTYMQEEGPSKETLRREAEAEGPGHGG